MRTIDAQQGIRILDTRSTASLLSRVLWITTAGFLFTAFGAYIAPAVLGGIGYIALVIASFALIFAVNIASRRSPGLALVLFYVFTTVMGIEIGPLLKAYLHLNGGIGIVFDAAITTAVGMAVMALVAQIANFNYQRVGAFAMAALLGLIIVGVVSMFFHFLSPGVYAWASLAIFSVLLLVDFMRLKNGAIGLSPVQMALSIYLDALNIFLALLQIFGGGRRDNR
ncbi:MAG TPA: Bax inhibitor-1 family protein [Acidobacteriaceae bacterium]|jgi:modulator of FtsH protease